MSLSTRRLLATFLFAPNSNQKGHLEDTASPEAQIDKQYLDFLTKFVRDKYTEIEEKFYHNRALTTDKFTPATYGNLHLAIPLPLSSFEYFYDPKKISGYSLDGNGINHHTAVSTHINFVYQYNCAFLLLLNAIDGPKPELAVRELQSFFKTNAMFMQAGVVSKPLHENIKKPSFLMGLLGYLLLDLLFSQDDNIPVASRVKAIELVKKYFSIEDLVNGFNEFSQGYEANSPMPALTNLKMEIQTLIDNYQAEKQHDIKAGIHILLTEHPGDAVKVILYLLQMNESSYPVKIDKGAILEQIIHSVYDNNAEQILGVHTSYRRGEIICSPELRDWAVQQVQIKNIENYVDLTVLAAIPDIATRIVVLEYARKNYLLEKELCDLTTGCMVESIKSEGIDHFSTFKINLQPCDVNYEETIKRNFRVLTAQLDKNDANDIQELASLNQSYVYLMKLQKIELTEHGNGQMNGHTNGHTNGYNHRR
jgi:hypothetical protein